MKLNISRSIVTLLLLFGTAEAASFTYSSYGGIVDGSATGTTDFSSNHTYVDPNYTLGADTVYAGIDWGIPSGGDGQSGLRTIPKSGNIESNGTFEDFGDLTHINYPITSAGGSLLYATVKWHLDLHDASTSNDFNRTWTFDLYNWETSNGADPCPRETDGIIINPADGHPYLGDGLSESDCDDAHDFGATMDQNYTWVNGPTVYKIAISGFYDDQDQLKQTFWAPENGSSTGYVKFDITEVGPSAVSIGNRVWLDTNNDGIQNLSETAGAPGVTVELWEVNATADILRQTTTTGGNGEYYFHNVPTNTVLGPIQYYLKFICPESAELHEFTRQDVGGDDAVDSDVNPTTGETDPFTLTVDTNDFDVGIRCGSIGDFVWNDENQNGIQDIGEKGIEGVTINLYKEGDSTVFKTTSSGINGEYIFGPIGSGDYIVEFVPSSVYSLSPQDEGGDDDVDSDANETTGQTAAITIDLSDEGVAQHVTNNDAGMYYCLCNDIKSDSSSAMNTLTGILMAGMTIILGLFFIRREEKLKRKEI